MAVEIEFTDEFERWWDSLTEDEQTRVRASVELLRQYGVALSFPHSSGIAMSRHAHLRELRVQSKGTRIGYFMRSTRCGMRYLLIGGDKTGDERWYEVNVPVADRLYDEHLMELTKEGLI